VGSAGQQQQQEAEEEVVFSTRREELLRGVMGLLVRLQGEARSLVQAAG
jgi:hypothetical protein